MQSVRVILVSITSLLALHGVLARTAQKSKNEDRYMTIENDISEGVPVLPIEGGYKDPEILPSELSNEEIKNLYGMSGIYASESGDESGTPYYYYAYNPRVIYDPKSPFYIGSDYDLTNPYPAEYAPDHYNDGNEDVPDGSIISEFEGTSSNAEPSQDEEVYAQTDEPTTAEDEAVPEQYQADDDMETEESRSEPYWVSRDNTPNMGGYFDNYMMGVPAQLQSFPMFNPEYYQAEHAEFQRIAAENERQREELEAQGLDANTVDNPANFPRGGRVKRGFLRMLNLRDKNGDGSAHVSGRGINGKSVNTVLNADCRGNNGGGRPDPRNNGGNGGVGNGVADGVADAAGAAQNAAGQVAGAAGDAVDAATNAAENLRLSNGRTNNRRNANNRNNRNNGRRGADVVE